MPGRQAVPKDSLRLRVVMTSDGRYTLSSWLPVRITAGVAKIDSGSQKRVLVSCPPSSEGVGTRKGGPFVLVQQAGGHPRSQPRRKIVTRIRGWDRGRAASRCGKIHYPR